MKTKLIKLSAIALTTALVVSCGSDNDSDSGNSTQAEYAVTITNLTYAQPFSPASIVAHQPGYQPFVAGEAASVALEQLAEGGSATQLLDEARAANEFLDAQEGAGVAPRSIGTVTTLTVPSSEVENLKLSALTMLIDTNDAFTGLNAMDISNMAVGQQKVFMTVSWDSGTEANTETADSMPGPAAQAAGGGGASAGFSEVRDDTADIVHIHRGVVTNANAADPSMEGLTTSILDEGARWDNPTAKILVERIR